eukprot:198178-Pyramimonas_sp.AAC.1
MFDPIEHSTGGQHLMFDPIEHSHAGQTLMSDPIVHSPAGLCSILSNWWSPSGPRMTPNKRHTRAYTLCLFEGPSGPFRSSLGPVSGSSRGFPENPRRPDERPQRAPKGTPKKRHTRAYSLCLFGGPS